MAENTSNAIVEEAEPTAVEASSTSHLKNVIVPPVAGSAEDELQELPEVKLPKTLKATLEALEGADSEPDARIRKHRKTTITNHLHGLSQGPAAPHLIGKPALKLAAAQNENAEEMLIEMLCRQYPVIRKRIEKLTSDLAAATTLLNSK